MLGRSAMRGRYNVIPKNVDRRVAFTKLLASILDLATASEEVVAFGTLHQATAVPKQSCHGTREHHRFGQIC